MNIEQASFNAWPALSETHHQGINLRIANGYTKRANSANVLSPQLDKLDSLILRYEKTFRQYQLPSIFRLPSFINNNALDSRLAQDGYQAIDQTQVMVLELPSSLQSDPVKPSPDRAIKTLSPQQWLESFCAINQIENRQQKAHLEILERIKDKTCFAVLYQQGKAIACGLAVANQQLTGLFDLATHADFQRQGHACHLIHHLLQWGSQQGATQCYLQVVANNLPAVKLYQKLGYQTAYHYHYRIKPLTDLPTETTS